VVVVLLIAVACVNVYRAATQSITSDEAFTYNHFAGGDEPLRVYDANNHVLFTWLARASVRVFGLSEFSLRLPAVLAGWLYLTAVFAICRRWFTPSWLFLLATATLVLNPFVLDFLSAARGYSLALALLAWALYLTARDLEEATADIRRWRLAAVCLALAVAANLNYAVPGAALAATFGLLTIWLRAPRGRSLVCLARNFVLPGFLLTVFILAAPLRTASRDNFYYGADRLHQTLQGAIYYSFGYARPQSPTRLQNLLWDVSHWAVPRVLIVAAVVTAGLAWKRWRATPVRPEPQETFLFLVTGTCWAALGMLVALKRGLGLKYPLDRTALYWIPLFTLLCLAMIAAARRPGWRLAVLPLAGYLALATAQYVAQFDTRFYAQWRHDAATKEMVQRIIRREASRPPRRVRIGASWIFEPSLNFYRQRYRLTWLERVTRDGPRGAYDYYLLSAEDNGLVEELGLKALHRNELSGALLAVPGRMLQSSP